METLSQSKATISCSVLDASQSAKHVIYIQHVQESNVHTYSINAPGMVGETQTLKFDLSTFDQKIPVTLIDHANGKKTDLWRNSSYLFTNLKKPANRFELVFGEVKEVPASDIQLVVYPNPFKDKISIGKVNIADVTAYVVNESSGAKTELKVLGDDANAYLDGSQLPSGTYILKVMTGDILKTQRVVK